jgi:DNA-binding HxlR family transcriptional regulator
MAHAHREFRTRCPLNIAVELLGDRWTLLIIRDLMFKGRHSFGALLEGGERISTNILTDRLETLAKNGIVESVAVTGDGRRVHYRLTKRGIDLAPVLVDMMLWSASFEKTNAPPDHLRQMRNDRDGFIAHAVKQWKASRKDG